MGAPPQIGRMHGLVVRVFSHAKERRGAAGSCALSQPPWLTRARSCRPRAVDDHHHIDGFWGGRSPRGRPQGAQPHPPHPSRPYYSGGSDYELSLPMLPWVARRRPMLMLASMLNSGWRGSGLSPVRRSFWPRAVVKARITSDCQRVEGRLLAESSSRRRAATALIMGVAKEVPDQ